METYLSPKLCANDHVVAAVKYCCVVRPCTFIIPPIPAIAYPVIADPNSKTNVLESVAVIVCGKIISLDALYTVTFGYCTPKL